MSSTSTLSVISSSSSGASPSNSRDRVEHRVDEVLLPELQRRHVHRGARHLEAEALPAADVFDRLAQRPAPGGEDHAGLFQQRDEARRRHRAELGVVPADQRFEAGHRAAGDVDLGLVVQRERAVLERAAQAVLHGERLGDARIHLRRVEEVAAARLLGLDERGLGVRAQRLGRLAVGRGTPRCPPSASPAARRPRSRSAAPGPGRGSRAARGRCRPAGRTAPPRWRNGRRRRAPPCPARAPPGAAARRPRAAGRRRSCGRRSRSPCGSAPRRRRSPRRSASRAAPRSAPGPCGR